MPGSLAAELRPQLLPDAETIRRNPAAPAEAAALLRSIVEQIAIQELAGRSAQSGDAQRATQLWQTGSSRQDSYGNPIRPPWGELSGQLPYYADLPATGEVVAHPISSPA